MEAGGAKRTVEGLYKALNHGDAEAAAALLAADVEYWFHGPPRGQHMMRVLTGAAGPEGWFRFEPRRVAVVGEWVVAEGEAGGAYWAHVWTVKDGVITQFREYFETWVTVRDLSCVAPRATVWQSEPREPPGRSLPSLVLAI